MFQNPDVLNVQLEGMSNEELANLLEIEAKRQGIPRLAEFFERVTTNCVKPKYPMSDEHLRLFRETVGFDVKDDPDFDLSRGGSVSYLVVKSAKEDDAGLTLSNRVQALALCLRADAMAIGAAQVVLIQGPFLALRLRDARTKALLETPALELTAYHYFRRPDGTFWDMRKRHPRQILLSELTN